MISQHVVPQRSRFRVRFQLEEFALGVGDTIIGRGDDCQLTIFDPLISRRHALIRVQDDAAVLEDLGSRNGCRVNGVLLRTPHRLREGDRIRIGKHELVFSERGDRAADPRMRQTGSLVFCSGCDGAYPRELGMCPACGCRDVLDEDTRSGLWSERGKEGWAVEMLVELLGRATAGGHLDDAERLMRQVMANLETYLKTVKRIDAVRLEPAANASVKLTELTRNGFWADWMADYYVRAGNPVPASLTETRQRWREASPTMPQIEDKQRDAG